MRLTQRTGERASEVQQSTMAAWYLAICFVICLAGSIWLADSIGLIDVFGSRSLEASKVTKRNAARKAAAQQEQARMAAAEDAHDIAADARRFREVVKPAPQAAPVAPEEPAPAAVEAPPSPTARSDK